MANESPTPKANGPDSLANNTANTSAQRKGSEDTRKPASNAPASPQAPPQLRAQSAGNLARVSSPSPASSPRTSRNASPVRKDNKPAGLAGPIATQPSAAAIQRALSAANAPQLQQGGAADGASRLPRPPNKTGDNTQYWPTSPRLKSPPPSASNPKRGSSTGQKTGDAAAAPGVAAPNAALQSSATPVKQAGDDPPKSNALQTPKGPSRGVSGKSTLETVQENSADDAKDSSPIALAAAAESKPSTRLSDEENQSSKRESSAIDADKSTQQVESGSESTGNRSPHKKEHGQQAQRPRNAQSKSYASLASAKSRQSDVKQGMTVETETVPSVPQSALSVGDRSGTGRGENSGSIRQKASSEAIRPKKERKRTSQKARSINSSTVSSKADIFEQRVANAVDEANSSESDETFVYESNPPEPQRRARHHSRTPSVASSHSVAEQQRSSIRNFGDVMDDSRRVAGKRSMKFSNNAQLDSDSPEGKDGSVRSHTPRHFGRFGRGGNQQSMFDPDSPFTQASKLRSNQKSKPGSPKSPHPGQQRPSGLFGRKQEPSYDFDGEIGDDERTPLMGTVHTHRNSRSAAARRMHSSPAIDDYYNVRSRSRCGRFSSCVLALLVLVTVLISAMIFLVMSNRPLYDVELLQISNVLASEQELIMDLSVTAVNPNALGITITDMDVDIFAKSKHVGSGSGHPKQLEENSSPPARAKRKRRRTEQAQQSTIESTEQWQDLSKYWRSPSGGVDEGTDPPDDDLERDAQTMLLGRVFHFDQALSFDASPLQRHAHNSTGELRLAKPGNQTETGGSARWERVLAHDFELIVRGSLKYQLLISSRLQSVAISGSVTVHPEGDVDDSGSMPVEPVHHSEHWQWVDWDEVRDGP